MAGAFKDQRIIVTGGAGFLGSHLVERLRAHEPASLVIPRSREHDLRDPGAVRRLFAEVRPDIVFHLAARVGGIGSNRRHPGTFFHDNMAMGLAVLEEARLAGVPKVVITGTICAYPKFTPVPFREDDMWNGYPEETNAPYGIAKKGLLVMAQAYRDEFASNFIMLFPVNLYGPRDNFDLADSHVIPAMIRKFHDAAAAGHDEVVLWGDGSPTREFLYVDDCAEGLLLAAERYDGADPVNLGSGREISIRDLATKIAAMVGFRGHVRWDAHQPNGQPRRMLDTTRARERFGFEARTPFDEGLARTIAWFKENRATIR